jgi:hypothetical protein
MNKKVCELFLMSCFVLLFLAGMSIMVKQAMAQGQPSNQTEIIVAKTPEEKANLERFDKLDLKHGTPEIGHSLVTSMLKLLWYLIWLEM